MSEIDLVNYFSELEDPRVERNKLHALPDILLIVFCGSLCGVESWADFVEYGESKKDFLKRYVKLENGIPSKNTFNRVISKLNPEAFKKCFLDWVQDFEKDLGKLIAIDGKALRRSHDRKNDRSAIHMVSAYASEARLVLAQEKVDEKSNEITAIPKLIDAVDVGGATITIDAMGCQKEIAKKIIESGGDYVLAVKGNQETLHKQIARHFNNLFDMQHNKHVDVSVSDETSRGRKENRKCFSTQELSWLTVKEEWANIKSVVVIDSKRTIKGETSSEQRYYISSLESDAELFNKIIRSHWSIENALHWIMDVVFREDDSRIRSGHAAQNMSVVRHVALNKLQAAQPHYGKRMSIKRLRKKAGWDNKTLENLLKLAI